MMPSGLRVERTAPQDAVASRRDGSAHTSSETANDDGAQAIPSGRRLVFTDPKALAIFHAANNRTFDPSSLPSYLRAKSCIRPAQALGQRPGFQPANSGTLSTNSSASLPVETASGAHDEDHWAAPQPGPDPADAAVDAIGLSAPPPLNAAVVRQAETGTPHQPHPPPWAREPSAAVLYPPAAAAAPPATQIQPVVPYPPAPLVMGPALAAQPLAPATVLHPSSAPVDSTEPTTQPPPPALLYPSAPATTVAQPQPQPYPPAPPIVAPASAPQAPHFMPRLSPPDFHLLPILSDPGAQPLITLEPLPVTQVLTLPINAPPAPAPAAVAAPPPAAGSDAGPWAASGMPPSSAQLPLPPLPPLPQPQAAAAPGGAAASPPPAAAAAAAAALAACLQPVRCLDPAHKERRVRAVVALAMSRAWDDCERHHRGPAGGAGGNAQAAGAPTRPQLLQFGWTTAQLDALFVEHFPPWPPGRMSYDTPAIMYETMGNGIASRGLRPKPGGGGADLVLAPITGWGAERAAEMEALRGALAPLEEEARRAHEAGRAAEEAELQRAARRQAQRRLQLDGDLTPGQQEAGAWEGGGAGGGAGVGGGAGGEAAMAAAVWGTSRARVALAPRLKEILSRTRMFLRLTLRPHLTSKEPKPVPLIKVLRGLRDAAHVSLDDETLAELGAASAEALLASMQDVAEVVRGGDGSVGLVASRQYRDEPGALLGLHRRCGGAGGNGLRSPPPHPHPHQQREQQQQQAGGCQQGPNTHGQQHQHQQHQRQRQRQHQRPASAQRPEQHQHQHHQNQNQQQLHQHQQRQQGQQQGPAHANALGSLPSAGSLPGDSGTGQLDSAGSWPLPSIFPDAAGLPQPSPQPSPHLSSGGSGQPCQRRASGTAARSCNTAFWAPAAAAAAAAADSRANSAGSSGYLSGASCAASSGVAGGGSGGCSRALSAGPGGSSCERLDGAASAGNRVRELPPHLRPKPASGRVPPPAQPQPKRNSQLQPPPHPYQQQPEPQPRPLLVQAGGFGSASCSAADGAAASAAAGAGGELVPVPVSRGWQVAGLMPVRIDQWGLAQAAALGADCLASCRAAGCDTCWQVTGFQGQQVVASRWGPTRDAAIQALRQLLLSWS